MIQGSKIFFFSGIQNNKYNKTEVCNLCKFINGLKRPIISWRNEHGYVLGIRINTDSIVSEIVPTEHNDEKNKSDENKFYNFIQNSDNTISVFIEGYVYGSKIYKNQLMHIPSIGNVKINDLVILEDPFILDEKKKNANIYAPMSDVGNVMFNLDDMYIHIPNNKINFTRQELLDVKNTNVVETDVNNECSSVSDGEGGSSEGSSSDGSNSDGSNSDGKKNDVTIEKSDYGNKSQIAESNKQYLTDSIKMIRKLQTSNYVFSKSTLKDNLVLFDSNSREGNKSSNTEEIVEQRRKAPSNTIFSEKQKKKTQKEKYVNEKAE
ncbi:small ribosomal subunit assembling AARP2 protein, partial [Hepatocystis sp. ex Piliocolobus tephrosceles]